MINIASMWGLAGASDLELHEIEAGSRLGHRVALPKLSRHGLLLRTEQADSELEAFLQCTFLCGARLTAKAQQLRKAAILQTTVRVGDGSSSRMSRPRRPRIIRRAPDHSFGSARLAEIASSSRAPVTSSGRYVEKNPANITSDPSLCCTLMYGAPTMTWVR